jgi:hypothetical protein
MNEPGDAASVIGRYVTDVIPDISDFVLLEKVQDSASPDDIYPGAVPAWLGINSGPLGRDPNLLDGGYEERREPKDEKEDENDESFIHAAYTFSRTLTLKQKRGMVKGKTVIRVSFLRLVFDILSEMRYILSRSI